MTLAHGTAERSRCEQICIARVADNLNQCQARIPMTTVSERTNQATIETRSASSVQAAAATQRAPLSDFSDTPNGVGSKILVGVFVAVPMLALVAAIPIAWGWGLGWHDVILAVAFYYLSGLGIAM